MNNLTTLFTQRLSTIPEFETAIQRIQHNPDEFIEIFTKYAAVVYAMSRLTNQDISFAKAAQQQMEKVSATTHRIGDLFDALGADYQSLLERVASEVMNPESEFFAPALDVLITRLEGGHQLKISGGQAVDGDQEADKVIWGHTLIQDPLANIHFVICHFIERYASCLLVANDISLGKVKDYFLNAMIDMLVIDHLEKDQFSPEYDIIGREREENGVGWRLPELLKIYKTAQV